MWRQHQDLRGWGRRKTKSSKPAWSIYRDSISNKPSENKNQTCNYIFRLYQQNLTNVENRFGKEASKWCWETLASWFIRSESITHLPNQSNRCLFHILSIEGRGGKNLCLEVSKILLGAFVFRRMKNVNFWYVGFLFKIIIMWFLQLGEYLVVFLLDSHLSKYLFSVGGGFCMYYITHVEVRGQPGGVDFLLLPHGFWGSNSGHQAWCRCFSSWLSRLAYISTSTPWWTMSQGIPLARLVLRLEAQPSGGSRRPSAGSPLFCILHVNDHLPHCSFSLSKAARRIIFSLR